MMRVKSDELAVEAAKERARVAQEAETLARERAIHEAYRRREQLATLIRRIDRRLSSDYAPMIPAGLTRELNRTIRGGRTLLASFASRVFPMAGTAQIVEWNANARSWIAAARENVAA